jgi:hypothetical protein
MTTKVWVDRKRIANDKATGQRSAVFKVKRSTGIIPAASVELRDAQGRIVARLVYDPAGTCASAVLVVPEGNEIEVILK